MQSKKPVIPIDIDGVVVSWQSNLPFFAAEHNIPTDRILEMMVDDKFRSMSEIFGCDDELAERLMRQYNSSKWIRGLKPYDDALVVINRLKYKYDFVAITAIGKSAESCLNRIANLNILFPSAFVDVMCVDIGESKVSRYLEAKKKYGERMVCFIDDLSGNLEEFHGVMSTLPMIHMVRGPRDVPTCQHTKATSMYDVEKFLESKLIPNVPTAVALEHLAKLSPLHRVQSVLQGKSLDEWMKAPLQVCTNSDANEHS